MARRRSKTRDTKRTTSNKKKADGDENEEDLAKKGGQGQEQEQKQEQQNEEVVIVEEGKNSKSKSEKKIKKKKKKSKKKKKKKSEEEVLSFLCGGNDGEPPSQKEEGEKSEEGPCNDEASKAKANSNTDLSAKMMKESPAVEIHHDAAASSSDDSSVCLVSPSKKKRSTRKNDVPFDEEEDSSVEEVQFGDAPSRGDARNMTKSTKEVASQNQGLVDSSSDNDDDGRGKKNDRANRNGTKETIKANKMSTQKPPPSSKKRTRQSRLTQWASASTSESSSNNKNTRKKKNRQSKLTRWTGSPKQTDVMKLDDDEKGDGDNVMEEKDDGDDNEDTNLDILSNHEKTFRQRRRRRNGQSSNSYVPTLASISTSEPSSPPRRSPRKSNARTSARIRTMSEDNHDDADSNGNDDDTNSDTSLHDSSDDDHENSSVSRRRNTPSAPSSPSRRSPRNSNIRTSERIRTMSCDTDEMNLDSDGELNDVEEEEPDKMPLSPPSIKGIFRATKKQREEDELSYRVEENDDDEDDDEDYDEDYDEDQVENDEADLFNDDMSFEKEESDNDDEGDDEELSIPVPNGIKDMFVPFEGDEESDEDDSRVASPDRKKCRMNPLQLKKKRLEGNDEYLQSDEELGMGEILSSSPLQPMTCIEISQSTPLKRAPPRCSSTHDEITMEKLPPLHVCYLAPDGKTRHCFCLDTLYRASIMSGHRRMKDSGIGAGGLSFLQPPHFRTVMEDNLLDQIASRFGRTALVIEDSDVYKKEHNSLRLRLDRDVPDHESFDIDVDEPQVSFRSRFSDYLNNQMGSADIYCCPICYYEAQRRFDSGDDEDDENSDVENDDNDYSMEKLTSYTRADPMSILGALDYDEFQVAATFCFLKLARVKEHVRCVHHQDTSRVYGNDLYKNFMIRAQDGLLQRYLYAFWRHRVFTGAMRKFWNEGHNQSFILLKILIGTQMGGTHLYSGSFPRRAGKIWASLMAPHSQSDDSDFLDDEEQVSIYATSHPIFEKPLSIEDELIQHLRKKRENSRGHRHGFDSSSNESESEDSADGDEDSLMSVGEAESYAEESASSEDEWVKKKLTKGRGKKMISKKKRLRVISRKPQLDDEDDDIVDFKDEGVQSTLVGKIPSPKHNNDWSSDEDTPMHSIKKTKQPNTSKKVTIIESDEDS